MLKKPDVVGRNNSILCSIDAELKMLIKIYIMNKLCIFIELNIFYSNLSHTFILHLLTQHCYICSTPVRFFFIICNSFV